MSVDQYIYLYIYIYIYIYTYNYIYVYLGELHVDESLLTGESRPVAKKLGDAHLSYYFVSYYIILY